MMNRRFAVYGPCLFIAIIAGACASHRSVSLPACYWEQEGLTVGVALGKVPDPGVRLHTFSTAGSRMTGTKILARDHNEREDLGRHPQLLAEMRTLTRYLQASDTRMLKEVQARFVRELSQAGWNARAIETRVVDDEYGSGGLDALIVIDCEWYGVSCHYTDLNQDLTDAGASLRGRMIDLRSDEVIWRSDMKRISTPISCRCNEPESFPAVSESVAGAVNTAASSLLGDLFASRRYSIRAEDSLLIPSSR